MAIIPILIIYADRVLLGAYSVLTTIVVHYVSLPLLSTIWKIIGSKNKLYNNY